MKFPSEKSQQTDSGKNNLSANHSLQLRKKDKHWLQDE